MTADRPKSTEKKTDEELQEALASSKVFKYGVDVAIAEENMILGNYEDAESMAEQAMNLADGFTTDDDEKIESFKNVYKAYAQGIMADAEYKEENYQAAADLYRSALHRYESAYQAISTRSPEALELIGSTQLIAASLLDNQTDYDAAVKTCQLALGLTKKLMPPDSREVAYGLINLAKAYLLSGDISEGPEALLSKAIELLGYNHDKVYTGESRLEEEITFENEERSSQYLTRAYSLLGDLQLSRGELDQAVAVWRNAVMSRITFWEEEGVTEAENKDIIDILCKLSVLLFSRDELKPAEDFGRRALWSLELLNGKGFERGLPDAERKDIEQRVKDLKELITSIHDARRKEREAKVRDDNAVW